MKNKKGLIRGLILTIAALVAFSTQNFSQSGKENPETQQNRRIKKNAVVRLFNGKNLSNWSFHLRDRSVDPVSVFTVREGVIHVKGDPFGYMRTNNSYSEYKLHVEWRYPGEASNSGVFVHAQLPDTIWLRCFECQLKSGNAGDFVCMNGAKMNELKGNSRVVAKMTGSSEKPVGEWNTLEVTCKSNTIEVYVNGVLQNKATGISETSGHICLQSEGKDIEFRNVFLTRLTQVSR